MSTRNYTFRKVYTGPNNETDFHWEYVYLNNPKKQPKRVNDDKPLLVEWLAEGNEPSEVIHWVEPEEKPVVKLSKEHRVRNKLFDEFNTADILMTLISADSWADFKRTDLVKRLGELEESEE